MARLLRPCPLPSLVATNRANPSRNFEAAKEPRQGSAEHPTVHCMRDKLSALHANLRGCTQWPHDNCCIPNEALAPQPNPESIVVLRSFVPSNGAGGCVGSSCFGTKYGGLSTDSR